MKTFAWNFKWTRGRRLTEFERMASPNCDPQLGIAQCQKERVVWACILLVSYTSSLLPVSLYPKLSNQSGEVLYLMSNHI